MNSNRNKNRKSAAENRNYKDTLFRMIFHKPEDLLNLYNAVNDTDYENPQELQIVTLENAIYMNMKNDLAREYQGMVTQRSLYSSRLVRLPTPYFVVFYNGTAEQPERKEMKLSDSFQTPVVEPALELKV
ncbi:MAG: hypothetical protein J6B43_07150, partial [Lachnospiraceae bacterium]|nr:hypothetical protein [Lachnospiraceae bacterium]